MVRVIGPLGGWQEWRVVTENQRDLLALIKQIFEELDMDFKGEVRVIDVLGGFQEFKVLTENQYVMEQAVKALKRRFSSPRPRFRQPFPYDGFHPLDFPFYGGSNKPYPSEFERFYGGSNKAYPCARAEPVNEDAY